MHFFRPCRVAKCHPYQGYMRVRIDSLGYQNSLGEPAVLPNHTIFGKVIYLFNKTANETSRLASFGRFIKN